MGPASMRIKEAGKRKFGAAALVLSFLASLAVGLLAVEVWVRASWDPRRGVPGFYAFDPVRGDTLGRNYDGWFAGVPVHLNRLGFRDSRDFELEKAPGTFRILVIGDSLAFGHGSVEELTYPRLLETTLRSRYPATNWQVWNLGVPGYNTTQELAHLLEVGPTFRPDLVIVGFTRNDVMSNFELRSPTRRERVLSAVSNAVRPHMYSLEWYRRLYLQWRAEAPRPVDPLLMREDGVPRPEEQRLQPVRPISDEAFAQTICASMPVAPTADPEQADQALLSAASADPGLEHWKSAVRRLQALHRSGAYRIAFFVDLGPALCIGGREDYYDVRRSRDLNNYFLRILGDGTAAVSPHDALARYHPSDLPTHDGHGVGFTNLVKAEVLADFLVQQGLLEPR